MSWADLNWRAFLEIAIMAVVIYYALQFIRGTRGAPVVSGFLIVLLAITFVTWALELSVLSLVLRNFFAIFAIAVIVLFQPELRRILAGLGNLPFLVNVREQRENIEVVVDAVERLSEVRIGMLVAMERDIQLQDVVESGVVVDCEATPEMLETIFFPNNAIHDGGVLMRGDRITHAACIFPLTQRQDLSKSLGTRHRAAIGLSEESDAVVIVVSEETGAIAYAHKGQLVRGVTLEELRASLTTILVPSARPKSLGSRWRAFWGRAKKPDRAEPAKPAETVKEPASG